LSIKIKKTKSKQIAFKLLTNLDKTNSKFFFAKFYDLAIKSLRNFELLTKSLNNNVISFYFTFVRASLTYIFLKNEERENAYKRRERICDEDKKDRTSQISCNVIFLKKRKCFEQFQRLVYE